MLGFISFDQVGISYIYEFFIPQLTSSGYYIDGLLDSFVIWMSWSQSDYFERSQSAKTGDMHYQTADIKGFVKVRILQHFINTKIIDVDLRIT